MGGLSARYYVRQFVFGLAMAALFFVLPMQSETATVSFGLVAFAAISTFLYPYSRFVYESVIDFIVGENVFFLNAFVMLVTKLFTMLLCWFLAIFIAPVGMAYLYYHHSKNEELPEREGSES
nr:hypothetical protein [Guyparkeria hydrothermalis]